MQDSIFTKIIKGDIPCYKIYEDNKTFVFLDIHPIQPGQVLVVPKKQISFVWEMARDDYLSLMATVQKVGQHLRKKMPEKSRVGAVIEGLDIDNHAHIKVFSFSTGEEYRSRPDMSVEPDHAALAIMADRLRMEDDL
ncbi:MAG: HIT domain-containing protein [Candidatus Saccharimonadales bacterium]